MTGIWPRLIVDQACESQVQEMFEQDFAHAELFDLEELDRQPFRWKFGVGLLRLAAPMVR